MAHRDEVDAASGVSRGFSLIELLVTLVIFGILGLAIMKFFGAQMKFRSDTEARSETHQGLMAAFDSMTRDIRLAGACLPVQPQFVPLEALNRTTGGLNDDTITVRTGTITANTACPQATLTAAHASGTSALAVSQLIGFKANGRGFIRGTATQQLFSVSTVSGTTGPGTVTPSATVGAFPANSGVYALEERVYSIDRSTPAFNGIPTLVLSIDGQAPVAIAAGIRALNIRYRTTTGCPACVINDTPGDPVINNGVWQTVTEVLLDVTAQSLGKPSNVGNANTRFFEQATVSVQPRNITTFRAG